MKTSFNDNWQFKPEDKENWGFVEIPHDWLIYDTYNLYKSGVGCYRKTFDLMDLSPGQKVSLRFDGVYMDSRLYINGTFAGEWKNGYTAFTHDITPYIKVGKNEVVMEVHYTSPNSRWYSGAGIYRDCWLIVQNSSHFIPDGIYISPKKENNHWKINVKTDVNSTVAYEVRHSITGIDFETLPDGTILVENPLLWDIENPTCYTLESTLIVDGQVQDSLSTRFGFREIAFSPEEGFILNGNRVQINGVCQHHDLGALGAAVHKDALRRQLEILRAMGVNAVRTAHNPPAEVLMELTDEMGFVVMSELTDVWKRSKTTYDYARFFEEWIEKDVAAWIRRDRNCPSVIMWSVGNEIYDTHADFEDGSATLKMLMNLVKLHDPDGHAPSTLCSNHMLWENTQRCADIIKLIGYNYADHLYKDHHIIHPDWIIYGGETASTVQSRGVYHFPLSKSILNDDDLQCSALGNSSTSWGAKSTEACIIAHKEPSFVMGQFIWTGTDYIGEPTPYHTKSSYLGQIDTAGFPKDSFYIFQAAWTKSPMIHLFPYWDWSPGQPIDVRICSNAHSVELFLNGQSLGAKNIDLTANYIVPYEEGVIKAVAYDQNGNIVAEAQRESFGDVVELVMSHTKIGQLTFTEINGIDSLGRVVENANSRVNISVTGGELLGLDNGDSTDMDSYKGTGKRMFNGKLLAITKGNCTLTASIDTVDIPIRKIELIKEDWTITAKIFPENTTCHDLQWRLSDAAGIDSPLGMVSPNGKTAIISPKGDGEVYIRCATNNGRDHISLISALPFEISGYGMPFLNPYQFISGGLYNASNVPMTNGNERGIATLRDGESHVGFVDLDFGSYGSDELTLWLFPLEKNPFQIEIWKGMPKEGRQICVVTYDKGSIWNTYQEVTYKLPERLCGVVTLCFIFKQKVHIKGFQFLAYEKAFEKINFNENDSIYGDSFNVTYDGIENIGNNVTITFKEMDFGEKGAKAIELCRRTQQDKNSIRILFTDADGKEYINTVTLLPVDDYESVCFPLDTGFYGKGTVSFILLPGCNIDLTWFRFF
ncbi:MAG: DUF4982 domain-containing protein [Defluviitaleaceae bacterium]|nr:DUF4982 domain-containing protein [Defluviitaleaceae bacterium]